EINDRLKNRERMVSQIAEVKSATVFQSTLQSSKKPNNSEWIIVDTGKTLESYVGDVMDYIKN
ncbi:MAG: ATP-binding protein, partial [Solibacillus sp.]